MSLSFGIEIPPGGFETLGGQMRDLAERLALDVSDRAARKALRSIRADMAGARLGRLGQAIGMTSDKEKGFAQKFSVVASRKSYVRASGIIYIRSKSPRTVGAIISYTEGSQIAAKNPSGYMWIPTDAAQRLIGKGADRKRLEPRFWKSSGMEAKLGPLIFLTSTKGNPILVVRNVGVSAVAGGTKRPRSLTRRGDPRKGDRLAEIVPIFTGIRATSRAARVNARQRAFEAAQQAAQELRGV